MGLDAYIVAGDEGAETELWYGRKENEIQGFFERNYSQENCGYTTITQSVLDKLQEELDTGQLVHTTGFFYGGASDPQYLEDAVGEFIAAAKQALDDGLTPMYTCWY